MPFGRNVKWARPDSIHLTLKFLGEVSSDILPQLEAAALRACEPTLPFILQVAGAGAFPGLNRPQVVWIGVSDPSQSLPDVAARLNALAAPLGIPSEKRPYRPHLTLGRVRSEGPAPELAGRIRGLEGLVGPSFNVERLVLMESVLKPSGAQYSRLFDVPFGGTR